MYGSEVPRIHRSSCSKKIRASIMPPHYLKSLYFLHSVKMRAWSAEAVGAEAPNTLLF